MRLNVTEFNSPLTFLLLINSVAIIILILNQNESGKDFTTNQNTISNPFENITWIMFFFQLILLLIKTKITDF